MLAIRGEPDQGFDPIKGWGHYGNPLFQSTLLKRDEKLNLQGDLATKWELSQDAKTWTVTIRDDVKFSDGQPLTADDVVFTYEQGAKAAGTVDMWTRSTSPSTCSTASSYNFPFRRIL